MSAIKITAELVKKLREKTGASIMECRNALVEAKGDLEKAIENLRKRGKEKAAKKADRTTSEGVVASYIHSNRIGVIVEFDGADEQVGKDVAMHIAAMKPVSLSADQVPAELIEKERSVAALKAQEDADQAAAAGKPAQSPEILAKRLEGSVQKYLKEVSLLNQPFVKNDKQSVEQMLKAAGTTVKSFAMFVVGEGIEKKQDDFAAEAITNRC